MLNCQKNADQFIISWDLYIFDSYLENYIYSIGESESPYILEVV